MIIANYFRKSFWADLFCHIPLILYLAIPQIEEAMISGIFYETKEIMTKKILILACLIPFFLKVD